MTDVCYIVYRALNKLYGPFSADDARDDVLDDVEDIIEVHAPKTSPRKPDTP